jgi:monolysocardiolipin acyltransferase
MAEAPQTREEQLHAIRHWLPEDHWYKSPLCTTVVNLSRFIMQVMNTVEFRDRDRWDALLTDRTRGILSFSNHTSLFDDPLLISNLGTTRYPEVRWIAADHRNFFGSKLKGIIFSAGKCVPIIRGGGLEQPGFEFLTERLKRGDWVHIFPEGGRTRDADARLRTPFKIGIGRLMVEARPIVMPFYHRGMETILPIGRAFPRRGKRVVVQFGTATDIDDTWLTKHLDDASSPMEQWRQATEWSQRELESLQTFVVP